MKTLLNKIFAAIVGKKDEEPRQLTDIVSSFETQLIELDQRAKFDKEVIEANEAEIKNLEAANIAKQADIERAGRIKAKFEDLIK